MTILFNLSKNTFCSFVNPLIIRCQKTCFIMVILLKQSFIFTIFYFEEKSGHDFSSHTEHLHSILYFFNKNYFLLLGWTSDAKSIVNIYPCFILVHVEITIIVSKWTTEQFGLQLWVNLVRSCHNPNPDVYASLVVISFGFTRCILIFFYIYLL